MKGEKLKSWSTNAELHLAEIEHAAEWLKHVPPAARLNVWGPV
jgi:hypothetical protein